MKSSTFYRMQLQNKLDAARDDEKAAFLRCHMAHDQIIETQNKGQGTHQYYLEEMATQANRAVEAHKEAERILELIQLVGDIAENG